jgi:hypothetical protein
MHPIREIIQRAVARAREEGIDIAEKYDHDNFTLIVSSDISGSNGTHTERIEGLYTEFEGLAENNILSFIREIAGRPPF